MNQPKFKKTLEALLKKDERLVDENQELNLAMVRKLADQCDEQLVELLMGEEEARKKFFFKVKDVWVFKQHAFKFFLDANQIDNSYTAYENRIGLSSNSRLLKDTGDVVLNFPYKDCVLEGGQSTEEGTDTYFEYDAEKEKYEAHEATRKEIFFNEVLAQDEIDRLYEPKAFCNITRYTAKGKEEVKAFNRDERGTITDNLIIKGNNLLALHSLKEEFRGKVKLIYIDPPYYFATQRDGDSFGYNSNFKLSTWLTFMKSRIEVSRMLLTDDGVIFISISEDGMPYLKVLMDDPSLFGLNNYLGLVTRVQKKGSDKGNHFSPSLDYILVYGKNKLSVKNFKEGVDVSKFTLVETEGERKGEKYEDSKSLYQSSLDNRPNQRYYIACPDGSLVIPPGVNYPKEKKDGSMIVPQCEEDRVWRWALDSYKNQKNLLVFKKTKNSPLINEKGEQAVWNIYTKRYLNDALAKGNVPSNLFEDYLNSEGTIRLKELGISFAFSKPVSLIEHIIEIVGVEKNDIVVDFFAGSGTTGEAVLNHNKKFKKNVSFVLVEQLQYIKEKTLGRVQAVLGNASVTYMELAKYNEEAKEKLKACETTKDLEKLLKELAEKYFLHYNVKFKEFAEKVIKEEAFKQLPIKKQIEMVAKMLDLNQLYVNASEMEDKRYGLSKSDIELTKNFYGLKK